MLPAESALRCGLQSSEFSVRLCACIAYRIEGREQTAPYHMRPTSGVPSYPFSCKYGRTAHT
ncbi:MAG: hypothetical protein ACK518_01045 [bacterium]